MLTTQHQRISDVNQNAVALTWAGAGQAERVGRGWTSYDKKTGRSTAEATTYTWSRLGLAGYRGTAPGNATAPPAPVTSWLVRMPDGTPVAQRYSSGAEYYYLFDGRGDVVGLEDPGVMLAAYDYCPTGNEADLASTQQTAIGLANPLRQYSQVYDDDTLDYVGTNGVITEDYNGTGTQAPAVANGDCQSGAALAEGGLRQVGSPGIIPAAQPDTGGGGSGYPVARTSRAACVAGTLGTAAIHATGALDVLAPGALLVSATASLAPELLPFAIASAIPSFGAAVGLGALAVGDVISGFKEC